MEKNKKEYKIDLQKRLFNFTVNIILLVRKFPKGKEYDVISYQLIKASTSSASNYEEAQAAVSKADFANKTGISLKEMCESNYWIRLVIAITADILEWKIIEEESVELRKILGSIYSKTSVQR
ncbi:MAG TPA: four helix bundle protein [Draconibacterium sp.]|nr:four helix bundle protein [Draconibacterium sp.]